MLETSSRAKRNTKKKQKIKIIISFHIAESAENATGQDFGIENSSLFTF